jgi:hypothetical protein
MSDDADVGWSLLTEFYEYNIKSEKCYGSRQSRKINGFYDKMQTHLVIEEK